MADHLKQTLGQYRYALIVLAVLLLMIGGILIWQNQHRTAANPQPIPVAQSDNNGPSLGSPAGVFSAVAGITSEISIHLSEGKAHPQAAQPVALATGEPLSADQIAQLLGRLPALPTDPSQQADFKLAQGPIPPPRTGDTVPQPFPPAPEAAQPPQVEAGPLKVLRFAPVGEIPIAPFVSITFNQPMVAVGALSDLSAQAIPVQMDPSLPGTWRWLGTQTLTFQADSALIDRLPKATNYHLIIPAGTKSATGGVLEKAVEWSFSTPPVKTLFTYPDSNTPQPLDPLFFITFDQRIDPGAVFKTLHVNAAGKSVSIALVSAEQIKADEKNAWLLDNAPEGRWIAFRAKEPLPAGSAIGVDVGPNTPSAEGPLVAKGVQSYGFQTYSPLTIQDHGCNWGSSNNPCPPLTPFFIRFNNPIDSKAYAETMLKVDPPIPGVSTNIYGDTLQIQGVTKGQTTYTVTVSGDIQDTFGQKLGQDARLTFRVGPADPVLYGSGQNFVTLDPAAAKPVFSVYTVNYKSLDVRIYSVQPSDWPAFKDYMRAYQQNQAGAQIPGRKVLDKSLPVESPADTLSEVDIDLSPYLDGKFGQFVVVVAPPQGFLQNNQDRYYQTVQAWVQVTQLGLDAYSDQSNLVVWASALKDGAPLSGVKVKAEQNDWQTTGADGTVRAPIPDGTRYLVASQGADQAILPRGSYFYDDSTWSHLPVTDELRWYAFDDRQMYRPGEEVHVKGWLRRIGAKQGGDVSLVGSDVTGVSYQVTSSQGNEIGSGRADVNALGGFDFVYKIPAATNLGTAWINLNAEGSLSGMSSQPYQHPFQIEEFRRPEFEVNARNETDGPYFAGGKATLAVEAKYYAGGPLPNADVTWTVSSSASSYSPPNWPEFTFGTWQPWWIFNSFGGPGMPGKPSSVPLTFTGKTDASGTHYLDLDFAAVNKDAILQPISVVADASVMDVNRQAWTGTTTLLIHPANLYVGLRSDRYFVDRGTPLKIDFIVTDLEGSAKAGRPVELRAARLEWKLVDGNWKQVEADVQTCNQTSAAQPVTCTFQTPVGGTYQITALVTDDQGRKNQSQLTRWVSGEKLPPARTVQQEKVTLIPDKESYQPGDTAQILVQSPFSPAEGLLTVTRNGLVSTQRFHIADGTTTLKVPIGDKDIPNLNVQVDLNGAAPRSDDQGQALKDAPPRPAFAAGSLTLKIPPLLRTLQLTVKPDQDKVQPGGKTSLSISLKDAAGKPVSGAELSVVVVDEAILALTNYQMADPLQAFYSDRPGNLTSVYTRSSIVLANPQALSHTNGSANSYAMDKAAGAAMPQREAALAAPAAAPAATQAPAAPGQAQPGAPQPIQVRSDFNPLAVFDPSVTTDENGQARVDVKVPDNLTRYRVMVVAVDSNGNRFGEGESQITARLPLMVRPSAPRFLNFGDAFELPVVLQNQTDQALTVDVAVRAANLTLTGDSGLRVSVPANDRVEVRFPAAALMAGTARLQVAAVSGDFADAATLDLPVYTPATTEAFATYGVLDSGAAVQPVTPPTGVFPQYGGLEITTSSTALQALTDAVLYLETYPFEGSEQLSSRVLAVAALRDVLTAFKADGLPSPESMQATVQDDLTHLQGLQNADGGFPYWRRGDDSIPFNTIHVAHALNRAGAKGFSVPGDMQQRTLAYLADIESHYPSWYDPHTRWTLSAYALYVRNLFGDRDAQKASKLLDQAGIDKIGLDTLGWLWPVLKDSQQLDALRLYVNNHTVETAGAANFTTSYDDQNYLLLGSDRRTDAILLDALIGDNPKADLIPKLVNGLLAHRNRGRWDNTQENVFVLLALDRYFNTYENQTPDFVAQIWLGDGYAGSHQFSGRSTDRQETDVPMSYLVDQNGTQNLTINKDGAGRLYYRLGLSYAPQDLAMGPLDMGFVVQRTYEAVDDPADVSQDADGTWHIKAGAKVRVHLTMVARDRRYHVALVDPLPAGLEIVNPDLAVSGQVPQDPKSPDYNKYGWWWWGTWYEHQNLRDNQAEAFASLLWDGVYQYTYIARATTPGRFIVPPAKAEEMYSPEVFGRSASNVVEVK